MLYGPSSKNDFCLLMFLAIEVIIFLLLGINYFKYLFQAKVLIALGVMAIAVVPGIYWAFGVEKNGIAQAGGLLFIIPVLLIQIFMITINYRK